MLRSWRDAVSISNQKKATKSARRIKTAFLRMALLMPEMCNKTSRTSHHTSSATSSEEHFHLWRKEFILTRSWWLNSHSNWAPSSLILHTSLFLATPHNRAFWSKKKWGEKCARQTFTDTLLWFLQVSEVKEEKELMTSSTGRWVRTNTRNATAGENQKATVVFFFEPECFESTDYYSSISGM